MQLRQAFLANILYRGKLNFGAVRPNAKKPKIYLQFLIYVHEIKAQMTNMEGIILLKVSLVITIISRSLILDGVTLKDLIKEGKN